jgi:hypothetical protein
MGITGRANWEGPQSTHCGHSAQLASSAPFTELDEATIAARVEHNQWHGGAGQKPLA